MLADATTLRGPGDVKNMGFTHGKNGNLIWIYIYIMDFNQMRFICTVNLANQRIWGDFKSD